MFEATLSEDFWGDEDFTCNQCHIIFTSRKGASEHAERKHNVRRLLIKDRAQVRVVVEPGDDCKVIKNIDVNMDSKGEYFEFMKEETAEEINTEDVKMEEPFNVNTSGEVGLQTDMEVSRVKDERAEGKEEVKDIKIEDEGKGPSGRVEYGEYIEEDEPETKFVPPTKKSKIVLIKAKPEIPYEEENEERAMPGFMTSGEDAQMDQILHVPQGTASVMDVHAAVDPIVLVGMLSSFGDQSSPVAKDVAKDGYLRCICKC